MNDNLESRFLRYVYVNLLPCVTIAYLVPLLWGSFVPFDFCSSPAGSGSRLSILGLAVVPVNLPDIASNIALYSIFGVLLHLSFLEKQYSRLMSFCSTAIIGIGISYLVEYSQIYSVSRVCSLADWFSNSFGTILGAIAVVISRPVSDSLDVIKRRFADQWREEIARRPSLILAKVCALVLFVSAVVPFDLTFSVDRLRDSVKSSHVVPFDRAVKLCTAPSAALSGSLEEIVQKRDIWQLWFDYAWLVGGYGVLAVLLCNYLVRHCRVDYGRMALWTITACAMLAGACSFAQLFIISRPVDVTEIIFAISGAGVGVFLCRPLSYAWSISRNLKGKLQFDRPKLLAFSLTVFCLFTVAREWAPFAVDTSSESITAQVTDAEWIPLWSYQLGRLPVSIDDLINKFSRYIFLGWLLCLYRQSVNNHRFRHSALGTAVAVGFFVSILELAQILLPTRLPAVTDVIIAVIGSFCGVVAFKISWSIYTAAVDYKPAIAGNPIFNVEFGEIEPAKQPVDEP